MGTQERKQREKERRRQQILVAAKRVFAAKGYSKARIEDIAHEAELSPGTLYLYFKNKDDLYVSLCIRTLQYLDIRLDHIIQQKRNSSFQQAVAALKDAFLEVHAFDPSGFSNLFYLQLEDTLEKLSPQLLSEIKKLIGGFIRKIALVFESGENGDAPRDLSPAEIANILWAFFLGTVLQQKSGGFLDFDSNRSNQTLETGFEILGRGFQSIAGAGTGEAAIRRCPASQEGDGRRLALRAVGK
jgi:AcrR family transcriptional regulator